MSNTIDNRVVEMQFDNKHFEKNVATSMSTLDKLKQKLNFGGAAKGLEDVNAAAKKTDMSGLAKGVENVHAKFSALQIMGVTALANITNSAVNAGKRMVSALTIDPIKTGFQEYETQINSVQTILSNTRDAGKTIEDVNSALDELNKYADQTIYNFTEMTRNIGTFTAAGVDLETSVNSIKGIANLAAVSGSTSQQASTAMYQLSQALASGTVKLMDWNSVVNAGMGGKVFQNALMETARVHGIAIDSMVEKNGSFRETLQEGWLTSEILTETLEKFTATTEGLTDAQIEQAKAMWRARGYTEEQIDAIYELGEDATNAATKVKTFTQLWDVLKESAQSGWAQTWKLIIGDFEEAKSLLTPLAELLTGFINKVSEARNKLIDSALGMGFEKLQKSVSKAFGPIEKVAKSTDKITSSMKDLGKIVDDVIIGKFGNGKERYDALTESGINYYKVQNKVNEKLGDSYRHSDELIKKQEALISGQKKTNKVTKKAAKSTSKLTKEQKSLLKSWSMMTEEQLKANGCTEDQIAALKELRDVATKLDIPLNELIDNLDEINGRWILINSFRNIGEALRDVFTVIKNGFREVFDPIKPEQLFDAIAAFHKFTEQLGMGNTTAENLQKTFKGLFAIIDIISRILSGGVRIAFRIISGICEAFGTTVLDVTGNLGDMIYQFDEWLKKNDPIVKFIEKITEKIPELVEGIKDFFDSLEVDSRLADNFKKIAEGIESIWTVAHGKFSLSLNSIIRIFGSVLELFGTNLTDVLVMISDYIVKAVEWIDKNTMIIGSIDKIANIIVKIIKGIGDCVKAFVALEPVQKLVESVKDAFVKLGDALDFDIDFKGGFLDSVLTMLDSLFTKLTDLINGLDENEYFQAGLDIIEGLALGIASGVGKAIDAITNIAQNIIDAFCDWLGIASPSKVFIKLGTFIISGLLIGLSGSYTEVFEAVKALAVNIVDIFNNILTDGVPKIYDTIKMIGAKLVESFSDWDLDFGSLVIVGTIIGLLFILKKLTDVLEKVVNPLDKLAGLFDTLKSSIKDFTKAKTFNMKTDAILNIAKAIALLAGSFYLLAQLEWTEVGKGAVALIAVSAALALLSLAASKMDAIEVGQLSLFMLSFSAAALILAGAMRILAGIYVEDAISAIISFGAIAGAMVGLLYAFGTFVKDETVAKRMGKAGAMFRKMAVAMIIMSLAIKIAASISKEDLGRGTAVIGGIALMFGMFLKLTDNSEHASKAGSMLLKMAIAMAIIPIVIKTIAGIDNADIIKGMLVIAGIELMFAALIKVTKSHGEHASKIGSMFLKMSIAMGMLALVMKVIATMSYNDIQKGLLCIAGIELLFIAFIRISKTAQDDGNKAGSMLFKMALGMALMGVAIKMIASTSTGDITKGLLTIAAIELLFAAMVKMTQSTGDNAPQAGAMMVKMSLAILILAGAIAILSILDPKDVAVGTAAISVLLLCFAAIAKAVSTVQDCMKTLIVIAATIALLVASVIALTFIDESKVKTASTAIASILGMLALLVAATKYAGKVDKSLVIILGVVAGLGGILYLLAGLPVESTLATAASLSILLLSLSVALKVMSTIEKVSASALIGMYALSGVVAILAGVLGVLAYLDVTPSIDAANAISLLLLTMSGVLLVMSNIQHVSMSAIGAMYALSGVVAIVAGILGILAYLDVAPSIETATSLSILLLAMAGATAILSYVGPMAGAAVSGAVAFLEVVGIIGGLMIALGALIKYVPALEEFLEKGIGVLEKIGRGIGAFVGGIVGGFAEGVLSALPSIGTDLSDFMTNAQPFIDGAKTVDDSVKTGVEILADSIMSLATASLMKGIESLLTFGSSFARMGKDLSDFITNAQPFIDEVKGLTPEMFSGVSALSDAILTITEASLVEGITRFLPFGSSLSKFGNQLPELATNLKTFVDKLGTFSDDQVETVKCAANAITALSKAASKIDGQSDWAKKLFGDSSLSAFSSELPEVANALKDFVNNIGTFTPDQVETVKCAADAIVELSKAAANIDGQSDWAKKLFGDNSLSTFSSELPQVADALKDFVNNIGTFTPDQVETAKCAANAIVALAKAGSKIDGQSDWAKKLFGDNGLGAFSSELPKVADNLKTFVSNLGTFGEDKINTVNSVVGVIKALSKMGGVNIAAMITNLPQLGDQLGVFADDLVSFCNKVGGIDSTTVSDATTTILNEVKKLATKIKNTKSSMKSASTDLGQAIADGLKSKKSKITSTCKDMLKSAKAAIDTYESKFKTSGEKLGTALVDGLDTKDNTVKEEGKSLGKSAKNGVLEYEDDFEQAGKDLGQGLIIGIDAKKEDAYDAGFALGQRAAQGVKDGEDSNSPSKLSYQYGIWLGEGLINGVVSMGKAVYHAGYDMGDIAAKSVSDAVSTISKAIDSDIDAQPTIRPVLDLDDVKTGARSIGGMFADATVGINANANAITGMMNDRIQNGSNDDVVSAIDKLRKGIKDIGNTTYNINGISSSDTDVADAIMTITRAAIMERRV